ncbi:MAG: hypothetical protein PHT54_01680 [Candidatus Nanoarchaeia archaeon]|nr:hypothetical protein [Candidatus Nanoarchaeia archaeon]
MIPKEEEILDFVKKRDNLVNFSMIAGFFNIKNATVTDIIEDMQKKKLVKIKKLGGSKLVIALK